MDKGFNYSDLLRMQTHENKHKVKPAQFISVAGGVTKRVASNIEKKRRTRLSHFDNFRNLPQCEPPVQEPLTKMQQRMLQLQKWKEEKERKKQEAIANKKKPFVVGIAKHTLKFEPPPSIEWPLPSTSGRVTRSQSARKLISGIKQEKEYTFAPKNAVFNPMLKDLDIPTTSIFGQEKFEPNKKETMDIKIPNEEKRILRSGMTNTVKSKAIPSATSTSNTRKDKKPPKNNKKISKNSNGPTSNSLKVPTANTTTPSKPKIIIEDFITFTPKNPVPKSESSSEEKLRSPQAMDVLMTPQQIEEEARKISPRVCLSRGKDNMRKEMKKRLDEGLLDPDVCDMSAEHFNRQLESEIMRMTEMCEKWDKIMDQVTLPDEIQEEALAAVGQARLLMSQKLQQFATLVRQCENPEPGQQLITRADLQGFWDMAFLQIENVDIRFKKLDESRARGWSREEQPAAAARRKPPPQAKPAPRAQTAPNNRLRDIIAAARRAKQAASDETKSFDAGFFCVQSPVKPPAAASPRPPAATPRRPPSLLQTVLSSEAEKSAKTSYAMLRASIIGKTMGTPIEPPCEAYLVTLTPVNLGLTPGKSILKSNNNTSTRVISKQLHFALVSSSDTASDSSPSKDDVQMSGVEILQDSDSSQHTSPENLHHKVEKDETLSDGDNLVTTDIVNVEGKQNRRSQHSSPANLHQSEPKVRKDKLETSETLPDGDNLVTTDIVNVKGKRNRRSQHAGPANLHHSEPKVGKDKLETSETLPGGDNLVTTDIVNVKGKRNRRSQHAGPANLHHSEPKVGKDKLETSETLPGGDNLVTTDIVNVKGKRNRRSQHASPTNLHHSEPKVGKDKLETSETLPGGDDLVTKDIVNVEGKQNRRSVRRSLRNAESNTVKTEKKEDREAEDKENLVKHRRNRSSSRSSRSVGGNFVTSDKENLEEEKENKRSSRRSARLQRQDAVDYLVTPVRSTRRRRKKVQTPE